MTNVFTKVRMFTRFVIGSYNLYRLSSMGNQVAGSLSNSVQSTFRRALTLEEKVWVDRIEQLRAKLNASTTIVISTGFGAERRGANWVHEEKSAGAEIVDTLGHISQAGSASPFWCRLLFKIIRNMQPNSCIEMGTCIGISAAYQAAALQLNGLGHLVTIEGASSRADIAKNNFQQLGLDTVEVVVGRFQDILPDVLINRQPVDYVFFDGHHDEIATLTYFEQIFPFLSETALLVLDDIAWTEGMKRAWNTIAHDRRVSFAVDLGRMGLCVIDRSPA